MWKSYVDHPPSYHPTHTHQLSWLLALVAQKWRIQEKQGNKWLYSLWNVLYISHFCNQAFYSCSWCPTARLWFEGRKERMPIYFSLPAFAFFKLYQQSFFQWRISCSQRFFSFSASCNPIFYLFVNNEILTNFPSYAYIKPCFWLYF